MILGAVVRMCYNMLDVRMHNKDESIIDPIMWF